MSWATLYLISEWVIRLVMLIYVPQRRTAAASRTWLLLIFLLPWPGLALYTLFGRISVPQRRLEMQSRASQHIRAAQSQMGELVVDYPGLPPSLEPVPQLARQLGDFAVFGGNRIELLPGYERAIDRLVEDIEAAQHHVHLLVYIFAPDATGDRVAEALARAAKRGVTCRVLMDAVGSKRGLRTLAPAMGRSGVEVHAALPSGLFRANAARFDLRNHRKIAVIDGRVGYTGSQNVVNPEFVRGHPNEELMVHVTGPVVAQLQAIFLADYYFETGQMLRSAELFPGQPEAGRSRAQCVPSGPGYQRENGQELIIAMLYGARDRVVITTPYLVPDQPLLHAFRAAARRGVAVHLILSKHANQLITQLAQRSYYEELLEDGIAIHLYQPRFLHAKHLTVDDEIALVGSTNMDIRSFALNAEINLLVYDSAVVEELRTVQDRYFADSERVSADAWRRRSLASRVVQNIARLADSLL